MNGSELLTDVIENDKWIFDLAQPQKLTQEGGIVQDHIRRPPIPFSSNNALFESETSLTLEQGCHTCWIPQVLPQIFHFEIVNLRV